MKTILLSALCLLLSTGINANETVGSFTLKCDVKNKKNENLFASIRIIEKGELVNELTDTKGKFEFKLKDNTEYLIEFISEDHFTKRIAVNTKMKKPKKNLPSVELTMQLIRKDSPMLMKDDVDLLDFPVSYIAYNEKTKMFYDKNEDHTSVLNKTIRISSHKYSQTKEGIIKLAQVSQ